jgi:methionine synthase II (cobalamin-independent)
MRLNMITGIGSFPLTDIDEAIDLIFSACGEIPFWPQLPKRSPKENMYTTFLERVPCVRIDETKEALSYMDTEETKDIERFYEDYHNANLEAFRVSEDVAPGFYRFLERLKEIRNGVKIIKGQLTGPFSMGLGLKDEKGKAVIYNSAYFDIIKKALNMKAKWMVSMIKAAYPEKEVIIFFDEPYMVSFGSAYISISKEETIALLNEVLEGVEARTGVHCCGNTDWSVLFNSNIGIVNYDAFSFLETIFYYPEDLLRFLGRGGWMSPGFVPSSEEVMRINKGGIHSLMQKFAGQLKATAIKLRSKDWLMTTSCGLGSLQDSEAKKAMELLKEIADIEA